MKEYDIHHSYRMIACRVPLVVPLYLRMCELQTIEWMKRNEKMGERMKKDEKRAGIGQQL